MKKLLQAARCVVCHGEISLEIGWIQLFSKESETRLCNNCRKKLIEIEGETCRICGRSFDNGKYSFKKDDICFDCIRWEKAPEWQGLLEKNISLFSYNDFLKETLAAFKFRGDYIIVSAFSDFIKEKLKGMEGEGILFVPIPLSEERLFERGFNQAEAIIAEAGFSPTHLLTRIHTEKQSKKTRSDRIHLSQVFRMASDMEGEAIKGKRIILIDDIYTTGSTLRHAARVLKQAGAGEVFSFTLARG
jgi:competence protein ComFC